MSYEPPGGTPPPPPGWQPPPPQGWQPPPPQGWQPAGAPYPAATYGTGYGYSSTPAAQSTKGLATALTALLIVSSLAAVFVVIAFFNRASVVDDVTNRVFFDIQKVKDADDTVSGAVALFALIVIATGVVWIIWQFRYAKNAQLLRREYGLPSGWAIGGWFVPLGNLVLPQLQLFQAARASDPDLPSGQPAATGRAPSVLVPWWVLLDLAWSLSWIGRITRPGDNELDTFADLDKFVRADRISGLSGLAFIAAGVLAILTIRACTERQNRALASVGGAAPTTPWGAPPPTQWPPPTAAPPPPTQWQPPAPTAPPPAPPPPQQWPPPAPPPPQQWPPPPPPQQWPPPPAPPPQ